MIKYFIYLFICLNFSLAKKHSVDVIKDERTSITLTEFGFLENGYLYVNVTSFRFKKFLSNNKDNIGFTLDRSLGSKSLLMSSDSVVNHCTVQDMSSRNDTSVVIFLINLKEKLVHIKRYRNSLKITAEEPALVDARSKRSMIHQRPVFNKRDTQQSNRTNFTTTVTPKEDKMFENLTEIKMKETENGSFSFHFMVRILKENEVGLYTLGFHNCHADSINLSLYMEESNYNSFLSIGDVPLPIMYFVFSTIYFGLAAFWLLTLCKSRRSSLAQGLPSNKSGVFKIHYLMLTLMYIKSTSLLFHGINYHFIEAQGRQEEAFAILFYIVYLMRGVLMFVTIALIGAGWTLVKHILSDRDKKIFVIVVPLQVLTNVAYIILLETEEGRKAYDAWSKILTIVDLMCCGAILFPIVWSIRHLTQAARANGKITSSLEKLKSFRRFYIIIVCYIYFTRIIILLLDYTVPFKYKWMGPFGVELATLLLFVVTGYEFRPMGNNPYFRVSESDDEDDAESVTQSGALETVVRVNFKKKAKKIVISEDEEPLVQAEVINSPQKESSHEYD